MLFDEYIKIFEEVLALTEKIEVLCAKFKSADAQELFDRRNELMKKLDIPEDIDDEKFAKVVEIKEKITKLNKKILQEMKKEKERVMGTNEIIKKITSPEILHSEITNNQLKNKFSSPKSNGGGSIFS